MATHTAVKNGSLTDSATWGGSTPANNDTINLGSYTVTLSTDLRATMANGLTLTGTGVMHILAGGALVTAATIPATLLVRFGTPELPIPAKGSLQANSAAMILHTAATTVCAANIEAWSDERTGPLHGKIVASNGNTQTQLAGAQEWEIGDDFCPIGVISHSYQYTVEGWDSGGRWMTHAAVTGGGNPQTVGTYFELVSAAIHICKTGERDVILITGAISGEASIYLRNMSKVTTYGVGAPVVARRIAFANGTNGWYMGPAYTGLLYNTSARIGVVQVQGLLNRNEGCLADIDDLRVTYASSGVLSREKLNARKGHFASPVNYLNSREPKNIRAFAFGASVELPSPAISGAIPDNGSRVVFNADTLPAWHTAGGVATKVQTIPAGTDLPSAWLLSPIGGRAYYEKRFTVKAGQSLRLAHHWWRGAAGSTGGIELWDSASQIVGVSIPILSYTLPAVPILEWARPAAIQHYNATDQAQEIVCRVWGAGDLVYARVDQQSGGAV